MITRLYHALANYKDELILVTGGYESSQGYKTSHTTTSGEVYSVAGNRWSPIPAMNVSRSDHGSCAVANYVYVACGQNNDSGEPVKNLQSIERINMNAIDDGWEELYVSSSKNISPRDSIFMAGLGCDELVIIGGRGEKGYKGRGFILDIPKMSLIAVIKSTKASIKFAAFKN